MKNSFLSKIFCIVQILLISGGEFCMAADAGQSLDMLSPTREMRRETIYMVRCMEELHFEHRDISLLDNRAILEEFLTGLDQRKMVFLQKDADELIKKFMPTLDTFVSGGSLIPAFNIFEKFRATAYGRIDWVLARLDWPFDFSNNEVFNPDREKCGWPQSAEEADALWERRLKFEILNEAISLCKSEKNAINCTQGGENSIKEGLPKSLPDAINGEITAEENVVQSAELPASASSECSENLAVGDLAKNFGELSLSIDPEVGTNFDSRADGICEKDVIAAMDRAIQNIKRRYESWRRSCRDMDSWLVQEMFLNSISKMYDPHTSFLSRDSFEDFTIHTRNLLTGIGAEMLDENGYCKVSKLMPGGPAKLSGEIKVGDKVVAIAQGDSGEFVDIIGLRLYKTVKLLRGKKDTVVRIKLETATGDTKIVRLVRDTIKLNDTRASAKYFEWESGGKSVGIGVVELPSFYGDLSKESEQSVHADRDVAALIGALKERNIDGLVLDLRQNGGGLLNQAILIAGLFITTGPVVQVKDTFGHIEKFYDNDASIAWNGPLIILSSPMSASASEILIGALRDHRRAVVVGAEATYGKGSVQVVMDMNTMFNSFGGGKDLGAAYITVQKWYLPTGNSTQLRGVPSDIVLPSLEDCFRKREADYPHALSWDAIAPVQFDAADGDEAAVCSVDGELLIALSGKSTERQSDSDEFMLLRRRIEDFNSIVNRKEFSLNIGKRLAEKKQLENSQREMDRDIEILEKLNAPYYVGQSVELPDIVRDDRELADGKSKKDVDGVTVFDTNLSECLRIASDWVQIIGDRRREKLIEKLNGGESISVEKLKSAAAEMLEAPSTAEKLKVGGEPGLVPVGAK
jgi:carboxyl-terminal processing protease